MSRIRTLVLALALGAHPGSAAAQDPDTRIPWDPAVTMGTLDNGLRFYIRANQTPEARAELRLVVNAGSVQEDDDQLGLAHLIEHMAFNGTAHFQKLQLVEYLESIGMEFGPSINAYTSFDETVYMLRIPTDDPGAVATAFQILEDWAHLMTLDSTEVDKERGVVIEEWRLGRGAGARMQDQQFPVLFQGSRYAQRLPIGSVGVLETFPHEALTRFYEDWYRPDLMAVVAVGDFDADTIEALIRTHFEGIPPREDPRRRNTYLVPDHEETRFAIVTDPEATSSSVSLTIKHDVPPWGTLAAYRRAFVGGLFTQMLNDRLFEKGRVAEPPYAFAGSGRSRAVRTKDFYRLYAVAQDGGLIRGLEAVLEEAERVARFGFTETELARRKLDILRSLERAWSERANRESSRYAAEYVEAFLTGEPVPGIEFEFQAASALMEGITLEEVNAMAGEWLTPENRVILVNAPEKDGVMIPGEAELAAVFPRVETMALEPYVDGGLDAPLVPELPEGSPVVSTTVSEGIGVTAWELANGVRVLLKPTDFKDDEIVFSAYSPGGYSLSDEEDHVSASLSHLVVGQGGVGQFSLIELEKKLAGKSVRVSPSVGELSEGMSGGGSPKDLETMLQLVYLYFTAPRADAEALASYKARFGAMLANRAASPMTAFSDTLQVTLTQGHPRARPASPEMMDELVLEEAMAFYRDRFADASDFTFVLVGALDLERVRPLVERYLGALPNLARVESGRDLGVDPPSGVVEKTVRRGVEPMSQTQLVFTGPFEFTPARRLEIRALTQVLENRLRGLLREQLGGTYSVRVVANYQKAPEPEFTVGIGFGSDPGRAAELEQAVFDEIRRLQGAPPTEQEMNTVREQERRSRETNLESNGWWVTQIAQTDQNGEDPSFLLDLSLVDRLGAADVQAAAVRYLDLQRYVRVTLLPETPGINP